MRRLRLFRRLLRDGRRAFLLCNRFWRLRRCRSLRLRVISLFRGPAPRRCRSDAVAIPVGVELGAIARLRVGRLRMNVPADRDALKGCDCERGRFRHVFLFLLLARVVHRGTCHLEWDDSSSHSIFCLSMIFSENRHTLFRIMLRRRITGGAISPWRYAKEEDRSREAAIPIRHIACGDPRRRR